MRTCSFFVFAVAVWTFCLLSAAHGTCSYDCSAVISDGDCSERAPVTHSRPYFRVTCADTCCAPTPEPECQTTPFPGLVEWFRIDAAVSQPVPGRLRELPGRCPFPFRLLRFSEPLPGGSYEVIQHIPAGGRCVGDCAKLSFEVETLLPTPTPRDCCAGGCDESPIAIDDLLECVNAALYGMSESTCRSCDPNDDGYVAVNELIMSLVVALNGCAC